MQVNGSNAVIVGGASGFARATAELLAVSFYKILEAEGLNPHRLTLWETPTCSATVEGEVA